MPSNRSTATPCYAKDVNVSFLQLDLQNPCTDTDIQESPNQLKPVDAHVGQTTRSKALKKRRGAIKYNKSKPVIIDIPRWPAHYAVELARRNQGDRGYQFCDLSDPTKLTYTMLRGRGQHGFQARFSADFAHGKAENSALNN
jgi:hypothetical protein